MTQSSFIEYINKYFPGIVLSVVEKLNDTKQPLTYLHKRMLRKNFSVTGKWEGISANYTRVAADVVAMDTQLPLKTRDGVQRASGDIPKLGMKLWLNENQLTELQTLASMGNNEQLKRKIFEDVPRCIQGVYERSEGMFLEGLSTGSVTVDDNKNVGTGVKLDYGFMASHKFGVAAAWTGTTFKPFDDIKKVLDKAVADGNPITRVLIDRNTLDAIAATDQAKQLFAFGVGFVGTNIPIPDMEQINRMAQSRYGFSFEIVDRSIRYEKNGIQTIEKPWKAGTLAFLVNDTVGDLVYADLAEKNSPVAGVSYQTADDFILVSKYRKNDPLSEFTSSQARVVPVISNVDQIYTLDSTEVQA